MNEKNKQILDAIKGQLIVSCQALPSEPLHSSYIMSRMAYAAYLGGSKGIRANSVEDIIEIKKTVDLPVIGIIKIDYEDAPDVYITPTMKEVDALVQIGVEVIAMDATKRTRPGQLDLDCSNIEEGMHAAEIGFDLIGTTMAGYTEYTKGCSLPPYRMIKTLVEQCGKPVIAEGNISTPEQCRHAMDIGVHAVVVGSAITRPLEITKKFKAALDA